MIKEMKKTILVLGIVGMFLLMGLATVSATQLAKPSTTTVQKAVSPIEPTPEYGIGILNVQNGQGMATKLHLGPPFFNIGIFAKLTGGTITTITPMGGVETFTASEDQPYTIGVNIVLGYTTWLGLVCHQDTFAFGGLCINIKVLPQ